MSRGDRARVEGSQRHEVEVVAVAVPQHDGYRGAAHQCAVEAVEGGGDARPRRDHVVVEDVAVVPDGGQVSASMAAAISSGASELGSG